MKGEDFGRKPADAKSGAAAKGGAASSRAPSLRTPPPAPSGATSQPADIEGDIARTMHWRGRALAARLAPEGDASKLLESLLALNVSKVRQPPAAAQRALAVARDENSSFDRLADLFENDPALTQALLQQANSAFYAVSSGPCLSIRSAIQRLGLRGVESVLMIAIVRGTLCQPGPRYQGRADAIWNRMTRSAPVARAVSRPFRIDPEEAFTLGLLHDIGELMLFDHIARLREEWGRELSLEDASLDRMLHGLHEAVGALAALRWGMGLAAAQAILWHHRSPAPTSVDVRSELLFIGDHVERARAQHAPITLEQWIGEGSLTVDPEQLGEAVDRLLNSEEDGHGRQAA
ncbi:MAG: HDOD domain-containing protein [Candidatus Eiseniibacteriota bacterium]